MQTASIAQLRKEMQHLSHPDLMNLCTKLLKFKKENKELLSYVLFESHDEQAFIAKIKLEIESMFDEVNTGSIFWAKKTLRKIARLLVKQTKFSGNATTAIELHIFFCQQLKQLPFNIFESSIVQTMYSNQLKKINKYMSSIHEDLQFDYAQIVGQLLS
jgi:hypothetical protein